MRHEGAAPELWLGLYRDVGYRFSVTRVRDPNIAVDPDQETLLAALKAKSNFAGQASEQTWLISILKHNIIDYFRKAAKVVTLEFDDRTENEEIDDFFDLNGAWQIAGAGTIFRGIAGLYRLIAAENGSVVYPE